MIVSVPVVPRPLNEGNAGLSVPLIPLPMFPCSMAIAWTSFKLIARVSRLASETVAGLLPGWLMPGKIASCGDFSKLSGMFGRLASFQSAGSRKSWCLHPASPSPVSAINPPVNRAFQRIFRIVPPPSHLRPGHSPDGRIRRTSLRLSASGETELNEDAE